MKYINWDWDYAMLVFLVIATVMAIIFAIVGIFILVTGDYPTQLERCISIVQETNAQDPRILCHAILNK